MPGGMPPAPPIGGMLPAELAPAPVAPAPVLLAELVPALPVDAVELAVGLAACGIAGIPAMPGIPPPIMLGPGWGPWGISFVLKRLFELCIRLYC